MRYKIKCTLKIDEKDDWKYKQPLIIRGKPKEEREGIRQYQEHEITTWCCFSQGKSGIETVFEKNTFEPCEKAEAHVTIH